MRYYFKLYYQYSVTIIDTTCMKFNFWSINGFDRRLLILKIHLVRWTENIHLRPMFVFGSNPQSKPERSGTPCETNTIISDILFNIPIMKL